MSRPFRYLKAKWLNPPAGEAEVWFHELDSSGHEVRKVVVFPDGHSERAGLGEETDSAALGPEAFPAVEKINAQAEFRAEEISVDLFEEAWKAAASPESELLKAESVATLERRIRPLLEAAAKDLRAAFPRARIRTESSSVGSKRSLQGHHVAISCIVADDLPREKPDLVDLIVGIRHLTTKPELESLYVCWGHPSGHIELELLDEPIRLDEVAWAAMEAAVPRLVNALRTAVARGQPPDGSISAFP
jgi:uncharacterized protein DUF6881